MIECGNCGCQYSDEEQQCPQCGHAPAPPMFQRQYPIPVVCAVIRRKTRIGEVLLDIRHMPGNPEFDGKWQLLGGKVGLGETLEQALRREIQKELNLELAYVGCPTAVTTELSIIGKHFILIAMLCHLKDESKLVLTNSLRWFKKIERGQMIPHDYDLMMEVLHG